MSDTIIGRDIVQSSSFYHLQRGQTAHFLLDIKRVRASRYCDSL